ncbi:MAG: peptidylprolyl isomerase [Candidatus Dormibacteria bacterium]
MSDPGRRSPNYPLVISSSIVVLAALIAIIVGVNHAATVGVTRSTPTATTAASASASTSAAPSQVSYADCSTATFRSPLQPLNPPADVHTYSAPPAMTIDTSKLYQATITTSKGNIVLCLQPNLAPNTVNVIVTLIRNHFYDGIPFHRVVSGFVIQGGSPTCIGHVPPAPATPPPSCGGGGPGFQFKDEPVKQRYIQGCVAMANSGPDTNGSQFFICTADDTASLQPKYNLYGKVQTGMDVALQIAQGDLIQSMTVAQQQ